MVHSQADSRQLKPSSSLDVDGLQQEVIGLLDQINLLIDDTQTELDNFNVDKYNQFQAQISAAGNSVANLELRMAIVAPMKAGKSTIINAIAGEELLPSCAVAMTTLPTEIVFDSQVKQPTLQLSSETRSLFEQLEEDLRHQVERLGLESLQAKLSRYPHLQDLFAEVVVTKESQLQEQVSGHQAIATVLNRLNHLIRLYSVINPHQDPLSRLQEVPCIKAPSLSLSNPKQAANFGSLTLIDTPGPNEAEEGLKLTAVVEEQLRRSSIVLVVLDFTQLNSEAAATIKAQIQPIVESIGTENLYVLVNKIDQRRPGDMTPEQVREFVVADLGLNQDHDHVFEISAIRAFTATKFLLEIQQNPRLQLLQIKSLAVLAQEVLGIDWDEELDDITVKIMVKKARKLWQKSGFSHFMDSAIAVLMKNAAPKCLNNALSLSRNHLLAIRDDLNLRHNAIDQDTVQLQSEIESLEQDLNSLKSCRERLSGIAEVKTKLQENLQGLLGKLKSEAVINVENFFVEEEYVQGDIIKKADINARNLLMSNLGDFELFPKWVSENLKAGIEYKTAGIISFKTELEAESFTHESIAKARQRLEELILQVSDDLEQEVKQTRVDLESFLIESTQEIIERAHNRLQTTFEVELNLPLPIISDVQAIEIEGQLVKLKSRLVDDGYEELLVKKRAWYYWFGMIPFYKEERLKKPYKKEDYYAVSVHEIVEQVNGASETFIDAIQQKVTIYLEQELHQQVDRFFSQLDDYLSNYLQSLQQSQTDRQLSLSQRENLAQILSQLLPLTTDYIDQTNNFLAKTQHILRN
ncbi:MAG: dynamin family protein [Cyanobacteria bacterium J06621_8]